MGCRVATLGALSLDGGRYGIAAPAVEFDSCLPSYLRITDINDDGTLNQTDRKSVNDPSATKFMLQEGDIVFARTGNSTGRNYYYDPRDGEFAFAGFLIKFSLDGSKVNPRFVKYYTQSRMYWDWVASFNAGSTRGNINAKTYAQMPILHPERSTQDAIVAICDALSDKIRVNNRINGYLLELLKASAKNLYAEYERNEELELPVGWRWIEVGEISEMVCRGITPKYNQNSDETVLGQTCVRNNLVLLENGRLHSPKKVTEKWLQNTTCSLTRRVSVLLAEPLRFGLSPPNLSSTPMSPSSVAKMRSTPFIWAFGLSNMKSILSRFIREVPARRSFPAITLRLYALSSQATKHWRGSTK